MKKVGAAIDRDDLSVHSLRHTRASEVFERTQDPYVEKGLLRHKSINSTWVYLHKIEGSGTSMEEALQEDYQKTEGVLD